MILTIFSHIVCGLNFVLCLPLLGTDDTTSKCIEYECQQTSKGGLFYLQNKSKITFQK